VLLHDTHIVQLDSVYGVLSAAANADAEPEPRGGDVIDLTNDDDNVLDSTGDAIEVDVDTTYNIFIDLTIED